VRKDEQFDKDDLQWQLRVSSKARYARLRILPFGGLEVVIPTRFPRKLVAGLVAEHADWARHQLARQAQLRESISLPSELRLDFDGSTTAIRYRSAPQRVQGELFIDPADAVIEDGVIEIGASGQRAASAELRHWIRQRARRLLPPLLQDISKHTGLAYNRVSIRSQRTRWGSCSNRGNISLNDQLLFLPADTVEYLMIHELCHTRHLNHSKAYWTLVQQHCPGYRAHEKRLGQSRNLVPNWFLLDLYAGR
jgi:predicted metal-dependent hydrolase